MEKPDLILQGSQGQILFPLGDIKPMARRGPRLNFPRSSSPFLTCLLFFLLLFPLPRHKRSFFGWGPNSSPFFCLCLCDSAQCLLDTAIWGEGERRRRPQKQVGSALCSTQRFGARGKEGRPTSQCVCHVCCFLPLFRGSLCFPLPPAKEV